MHNTLRVRNSIATILGAVGYHPARIVDYL